MRNIVVINGHLNILEFLHKKGVSINEFHERKKPLTTTADKGWVDTESKPRQRGLDDAKFNHARVVHITHA